MVFRVVRLERVGAWLEAYFDHDYIFVFDGNDRMAEGVETADQQLFLRAAGVHSMQGFPLRQAGNGR